MNATPIMQMLDLNFTGKLNTEEFYMCYVEGAPSPKVKHQCLEEARDEAERLSAKTGKQTYLLAAVASCIPDPRLDVAALVQKATDLGLNDIAKALLTCSILAQTAADFVPETGEFSELWFATAATLKN